MSEDKVLLMLHMGLIQYKLFFNHDENFHCAGKAVYGQLFTTIWISIFITFNIESSPEL